MAGAKTTSPPGAYTSTKSDLLRHPGSAPPGPLVPGHGAHIASYPRKASDNVIKKYRVEYEEPVYDNTGVARGHFFTESD